SLAALPPLENERPGADGARREVVALLLRHLARHHGAELHRQLVEEDRIGLAQADAEAVVALDLDAADLRAASLDEVVPALDAAEELGALGARRRAQYAL